MYFPWSRRRARTFGEIATRYPVSLSAPGVAFSTTVEVTRCQLTVDPTSGRFFRVTAKFFPYVE